MGTSANKTASEDPPPQYLVTDTSDLAQKKIISLLRAKNSYSFSNSFMKVELWKSSIKFDQAFPKLVELWKSSISRGKAPSTLFARAFLPFKSIPRDQALSPLIKLCPEPPGINISSLKALLDNNSQTNICRLMIPIKS